MTQNQQETRAEELTRVRSYLASQSMKRTPEQLVETLQEAHHQFVSALAMIPDAQSRTIPHEGEWSALDVLLHMHRMAAFDISSISAVLERGEQPSEIQDVIVSAPPEAMRATLLAELIQYREQLFALVQRTDGQKALNITWLHPEFGEMNWREWTLFARVHTLDHARQLQSIAASLAQQEQEKSV